VCVKQTRNQRRVIGQLSPPKFSQTYVFVWCSNKLHHFAPLKVSVGCGPGVKCHDRLAIDHPHSLHNKGNRSKYTNYRGISLLSLPGRVYAKFVKKIRRNNWSKAGEHARSMHYRTNFHSPANFWEILGACSVCQKLVHMFCRPRESI